jgi:MFS family permease
MRAGRVGLLVALGVDTFGSGLFLPLALLYVTRAVGLPLATAGTVVALGTAAGLAVPVVAGRLVDRVGSWRVVAAAQVVQAAGAAGYLAARGVVGVAVAAGLLAAGQQLFYSSLFALIADVSGEGPKDRPFAVAAMVRSACFSLGGLSVGGLLTVAGTAGYRIAVAVDAVSFGACAVLLAVFVRVPGPPRRDVAVGRAAGGGVWSDRPFLAVIAAMGLAMLAGEFYLSGISVYMIGELGTRPWVPGVALAVNAGLISVGATAALWATRRVRRTTVMSAAAGLYVLCCALCVAAVVVPPGWRPAELLATAVVMAVGTLLFGRANALAEAAAPAAVRGRYLAAFQYGFTVPGVIAPAVVALFSVAVWLPWLLTGGAAVLAVVVLRWAAGHLPEEALRPGRVVAAGASPVSRA